MSAIASTSTEASRRWFGQPPGLTILFLTNMWEQFSYYGMRALLVYYMTKHLMFGQAKASIIYGLYTGCAYFTPILGGLVADRLLGKRRAIIIGATVMALGHFMMAFEPLLYLALGTIALGNGLFLPTLPSQVGDLYRIDDPRRGWAFNVYYVGINIGGFLAPLVCGTLGEVYGWHYGFGAAGVGMLIGLCLYLFGQCYLPAPVLRHDATRPVARTPYGRDVVIMLAAIALAVTVFRGAYEQIGNTLALWADSGVDRRIGGMTIPMTWFQSLNPLFVMLMTPPLLAWWARRTAAGAQTSAARRMAVGALIVAGAYALLATLSLASSGMPVSWLWLLLFLALFTFGELFILPTGLGIFASLAPSGLSATTVAAWFFAIFTGNLTAGLVGTLWGRLPPSAFFALLAGLAVLAAAMLWSIARLERSVERRLATAKSSPIREDRFVAHP